MPTWMALKVDGIVNGRMHAQETLGGEMLIVRHHLPLLSLR